MSTTQVTGLIRGYVGYSLRACEAVRRHGELIRKENERLLGSLRVNLSKLRENRLRCRTTLVFEGPTV